jgi:hypothetical protein
MDGVSALRQPRIARPSASKHPRSDVRIAAHAVDRNQGGLADLAHGVLQVRTSVSTTPG